MLIIFFICFNLVFGLNIESLSVDAIKNKAMEYKTNGELEKSIKMFHYLLLCFVVVLYFAYLF